ncbi:hypothetical protein OEA41_004021 [Lepraria neglecta]|uniref:DUF7730 domain-containing protein n=1 Tax=Lepraria neglecta TaxID=209136 RepID=A0AAD9Z8X3_9LECA|nr:hypothetical protein OEA41_004021 [Lepraria neglecta]
MESSNNTASPASNSLAAIPEHKTSSLLLKLPQETKNQIYELVCGGQFLHITKDLRLLSNHICRAKTSEDQAQEEFDTGLRSEWNAADEINPHIHCKPGKKDEQNLSISILLSCRQAYNEARLLPYSTNTFSFGEPRVLLSFIAKAMQSGASLATRSVHLHMFIKRDTDVDAWRRALRLVSKELTGLQNVYIMMDQGFEPARHVGYVAQHYRRLDHDEFAKLDERWWTSLLASLDKLQKLPLKKATFVISDKGLEVPWGKFVYWQIYQQSEMAYRWTLEEKRAWSKDVRQVILRQKSSSVA